MKYFIVCIILLLSFNLLPGVVASHLPPVSYTPGQQVEIRVEIIQGLSNILNAELLYRSHSTDVYRPLKMDNEGVDSNWLRAYLPALTDPDQVYEYYFRFTLINNSIETYPVLEPDLHPFVVKSAQANGEQKQGFILVSDESSRSARDGYLLAVSWYALEDEIDPSSIQVFVNGRDVTAESYIGNSMLLYQEKNVKPGIITARVKAMSLEQREFVSPTWKTIIKPTGALTMLPLNLRGSVNAGTNVYGIAKDPEADTFGSGLDDGWASLDMYASYDKLNLLYYTYLSTLQNERKQNLDRFRLGVQLPFWQTFLGDYSPGMSTLTMNNRNIRGIYSKLQGKYIGLSLAQGEILRKIDGHIIQDSTHTEINYSPGVFKQEAFGARLQLGSPQGFLMGFTTTRNRDIISSLSDRYIEKGDTVLVYPQDNLVLSWDSKLTIPKAHLVLGVEGAGSLFNKNILNGPDSTSVLEEYLNTDITLNPADFQDIFVMNTNMEPLPLSSHLSSLAAVTAWQGFIRNQLGSNLFNASISQVGASYHALSTNYMPRDVTRWLISDQYNYRQNFIFTGGFSQNRDNLSDSNLETNISNNSYAQGMLRLPRYPYLSLTYSNINSKNEKNRQVATDSLAALLPYYQYKQKSNSVAIGSGYEFNLLPVAPTTLDISWRSGSGTRDAALDTLALVRQYDIKSGNFSIGLTSRFSQIPLKTQFTISTNSQTITMTEKDKTTNLNFLMRGDYKLLNQKYNPWAELIITSLGGDQAKQAYDYITFGLDAAPLANFNVSTSLGWQIYHNADQSNRDYTKTVWHLTLTQRF